MYSVEERLVPTWYLQPEGGHRAIERVVGWAAKGIGPGDGWDGGWTDGFG